MKGRTFGLILAIASLAGRPVAAGTIDQPGLDRRVQELRSQPLQNAARPVKGLKLDAGPLSLTLSDGHLYPVEAIDGEVREFVFIGRGLVRLTPPEGVEQQQLTFFTGSPILAEPISAAVVSLGMKAASDAFLRIESARPAAGEFQRATELLDRWRGSAERRLLAVENALLADSLGDPAMDGYFTAWLEGRKLGTFLASVDPREVEQVALGRFEPVEFTQREQRKARRELVREQRGGRLLGLRLEDLGQWNQWVSMSRQRRVTLDDGASELVAAPGRAAFEPSHYRLDARFGADLEMTARACIAVTAQVGAGLVLPMLVGEGLVIDRISVAEAEAEATEAACGSQDSSSVPYLSEPGRVAAFLPSVPADGQTLQVEVEYHGSVIDRESGKQSLVLTDSFGWYPHVGERDLATYDVELHLPRKWEVFAAGKPAIARAPSGQAKTRTERFVLDTPYKGFSFQFGKFKTFSRTVGDTELVLALDQWSWDVIRAPEVVLDWIASSWSFLSESFGDLGYERVVVATNPRWYSQAFPGFVSLSTLMIYDDALMARFGQEDPAAIVAHELSHLWWGHQVSWQGYRDQWLSEALANYSANLFRRRLLQARKDEWSGPFSGWQGELLFGRASNGYPLAEVGSMTLGVRLASSKADAYFSTVYTKGGLVLQMLADVIGEDRFVSILKWMAGPEGPRVISTEWLLSGIASATGQDLDAFAETFVYGTGVPRARWQHEIVEGDAAPRIAGRAWLEPEVYRRFRIVEHAETLDVVMERFTVAEFETELALALPLYVEVPEAPADKARRGNRSRREPQAVTREHMALLPIEALEIDFDLELPAAPSEVDLASRERCMIATWEVDEEDRLSLVRQAARARIAEPESALELYRRAAALPERQRDDDGEAFSGEQKESQRVWIGAIHQRIAHLLTDLGRVEEARQELEILRQLQRRVDGVDRDALKELATELEARWALRAGDAAEAQRLLTKVTDDGESRSDLYALVLFATAAHQAGDSAALERATKSLEGRTFDVEDLWRLEQR